MHGFSDTGKAGWRRCENCGVSVYVSSISAHECGLEYVVRYQAKRIEESWAEFLDSNAGRFAVYAAERERTAA